MDRGDGVEEGDRGDGGGDAPAASVAAVTTRLAKADGPEVADDDAVDRSVDGADGCVGGGLPEVDRGDGCDGGGDVLAAAVAAFCVGAGRWAEVD